MASDPGDLIPFFSTSRLGKLQFAVRREIVRLQRRAAGMGRIREAVAIPRR